MKQISDGGWNYEIYAGDSSVGVVLVHEIFGLDDYIRDCAASLAKSGFTVAAVDLYRGKYEPNLEKSFTLRKTVDRPTLLDCMGRALEIVRKEGPAVVGSMGFCMGGGFALYSACHLDYRFAVDYYGTIEEAEDLRALGEKQVLLVEGLESERDMKWVRDLFVPSVAKYRIRTDMHFYPGAAHAFHRPDDDKHHPAAAKDAWEKTVRFISQFAKK